MLPARHGLLSVYCRLPTGGRVRWWAGFWLLLFALTAQGQTINRQRANTLLAELARRPTATRRLAILLELARFHIYKPGESAADLDSSRAYLTQSRQLSASLHQLTRQHETECLFIVADLEAGQSATGQARFSELIARCQRTRDAEGEAIARFRFATWLRNYAPDSVRVLGNFRRAAQLYRTLNKPADALDALKEVAVTHLYEGRLPLAQAELRHVLDRYKAIGYPNLHYTYNLLSTIGRLRGDLNEGLRYGLLCVESMKKTGDTASAAGFYGDLAQLYMEAGNRPLGIDWYKRSLAAWRREGLPNFALFHAAGVVAKDLIDRQQPRRALAFFEGVVRAIPTNTLIQKGCVAQNLAACHDALGHYDQAERYYREAFYWYEKNKLDFEGSLQIRRDIGAFYLRRKQYRQAEAYLTKALTVLPQKEALATLQDIHLLLFRVDSARGNYPSAIRHFQVYKAYNDSLFNEVRSRQLAQLQIQYDTRTKEQNIALLTKQSELQQSALKRAETGRNGILVGALLLASLLGVSYNRYQLRQRSNRVLQAKQLEIDQKNRSLEHMVAEKEALLVEKEWMLKEIHHRVKNNLQVITSLLNAQSDYLHDPTALSAIRESQNRVQTMALIHQRLYQSAHLASVDMAEYVGELIDYLLDSFERPIRVATQVSVAPVRIDVTMATPLGLIINEAVTNSLKYAFLPGAGLPQAPTIGVSLQPLPPTGYRLLITDNGVGLPPGFSPADSPTLGLTMIQGLSRQLGGTLQISTDAGVRIQVDFSPDKKTGLSWQRAK